MSVLATARRFYLAHRRPIVIGAQATLAMLAFFSTPIVRWLGELQHVEITASAYYNELYEPHLAGDGNVQTEWCLPDGTLGHLDLSFNRKRPVRAVVITNGHNAPWLDRAVTQATLLVYDGDKVLDKRAVSLPGIERELKPRRFAMGGKVADRVRLEVTGVAGNGGAIAEIHVE